MMNLPKSFQHSAQSGMDSETQTAGTVKMTRGEIQRSRVDRLSTVQQSFPIWQITAPLGVVLIFAISSLTAYFMVEGRFVFDLYVSPQQIRMKANVDKTKSSSSQQDVTDDRENLEITK